MGCVCGGAAGVGGGGRPGGVVPRRRGRGGAWSGGGAADGRRRGVALRGGVAVGVMPTGRESGGCDTNRTPCLVGADGKATGVGDKSDGLAG
jgi:hypothetical protein